MKKIRILVSEDHNLVRQGLVNILQEDPELLVVGESEDGNSLIEKYKLIKPDIVLSDISMPKMSGIDAARNIIAYDADAKIIFLTIYSTDDFIYKTIKIGAKGLVSKQSIKGEVISAVKTVMKGELYFSGKTEEEIEIIKKGNIVLKPAGKYASAELLNEHELEVLLLIANGLTSEEIASKISLGKRAVDHCRSVIMEKLELKSLPQLIKYAVEYSYNKEKNNNL